MKKTVLYREIDGHKIITGFDSPTVDGVATDRIVFGESGEPGLIHKTPEWQSVEAKKAEYAEALKALRTAQQKKDEAAYKAALSAMSVRQDELKPLARVLSDKITVIRLENAVYFEPRKGEVIRDASEVVDLSEAIQGRAQDTFITLEGDMIENNRGMVYFRKVSGKWQRTHIVKLGDTVPADAVTKPDETQQTEIERDRVAMLPADIRMKEKDKAMKGAMAAAATMKSELEIKADPDALTKSQGWYRDEVARIEGLYG